MLDTIYTIVACLSIISPFFNIIVFVTKLPKSASKTYKFVIILNSTIVALNIIKAFIEAFLDKPTEVSILNAMLFALFVAITMRFLKKSNTTSESKDIIDVEFTEIQEDSDSK